MHSSKKPKKQEAHEMQVITSARKRASRLPTKKARKQATKKARRYASKAQEFNQ